jgi:hypothetical protein
VAAAIQNVSWCLVLPDHDLGTSAPCSQGRWLHKCTRMRLPCRADVQRVLRCRSICEHVQRHGGNATALRLAWVQAPSNPPWPRPALTRETRRRAVGVVICPRAVERLSKATGRTPSKAVERLPERISSARGCAQLLPCSLGDFSSIRMVTPALNGGLVSGRYANRCSQPQLILGGAFPSAPFEIA